MPAQQRDSNDIYRGRKANADTVNAPRETDHNTLLFPCK